jgi:hypothetical protein
MSEQENPFQMDGTEGTGEYVVLATSSFGRVGYRDLGDVVRVRVEPSTAHTATIAQSLTSEAGWKQPGDDGQDRFSLLVPKGEAAKAAVSGAFALIKRGRPLAYHPQAPDWVADLS